jgi:hypothetical protein
MDRTGGMGFPTEQIPELSVRASAYLSLGILHWHPNLLWDRSRHDRVLGAPRI